MFSKRREEIQKFNPKLILKYGYKKKRKEKKGNVLYSRGRKLGPVRESNPGPLAPEARIIPLDQQAKTEVTGCKSRI